MADLFGGVIAELERTRAQWHRAMGAAREMELDGVVSGSWENEGRRGSLASSVVERAALGRDSSGVRELLGALGAVELAVGRLGAVTSQWAGPVVSRRVGGGAVVGCCNRGGCPTLGVGVRRLEGFGDDLFCGACWQFFDSVGRPRTQLDVIEAAKAVRDAAAARKRKQRASE